MSSNNDDDDTDDIVGGKFIERNTHAQITVKEGRGNSAAISAKENFRVLGIFTKYDGKWYISDSKGNKQHWSQDIASGKYRVIARMITYDHGAGNWQDTDPAETAWSTKCIYILVDASKINDFLEKITLDEEW